MKLINCNNGNKYFILCGQVGERALLCDIDRDVFIVCLELNKDSWLCGEYFNNLEQAYEFWKKEIGG